MKNPANLKRSVIALHDRLKMLAMTARYDFPGGGTTPPDLLENIAELQTVLAAYARELLFRLFQSSQSGSDAVPSKQLPSKYVELWRAKAEISRAGIRPENEIDASIRQLVAALSQQMKTMSEEELRSAVSPNLDIPELLYYLVTVQESLAWYLQRYLGRMAPSSQIVK